MELNVAQIRAIIAEKIPTGLIVPEHTESAHFYRHTTTNQLLASVTTKSGIIDSPHLKKWAVHLAVSHIESCWERITPDNKDAIFTEAIIMHEERLKDAGWIGTLGHGVIEDYLNGWMASGVKPNNIIDFIKREEGGTDVRLFAISRSAEKFFNDFKFEPIASELLICSLLYKYAGTLDCLGFVEIDGKRTFALIDFKTSNTIEKIEYSMQVAAYRQALIEMIGINPEVLIIVRFDKNAVKYEVRTVPNPASAFGAFLHATAIYDWMNESIAKPTLLQPKTHTKLVRPQ